jgi:hypothetical protein
VVLSTDGVGGYQGEEGNHKLSRRYRLPTTVAPFSFSRDKPFLLQSNKFRKKFTTKKRRARRSAHERAILPIFVLFVSCMFSWFRFSVDQALIIVSASRPTVEAESTTKKRRARRFSPDSLRALRCFVVKTVLELRAIGRNDDHGR